MYFKSFKRVVLAVVFSNFLFVYSWGDEKPLPTVAIAKITMAKDQPKISSFGNIKALKQIDVSAVCPGIITSIQFKSGQSANRGDVLVTLRNADLMAIVDKDRIHYQVLKREAERAIQLVRKKFIAQQSAERTISAEKQAEAQLHHDQAMLNATIIRAPFSGTLGIKVVDVGQYISAGQKIVSLQDNSKLFVEFSIPENCCDQVNVGDAISIQVKQSLLHQWNGKLIVLDNHMDPSVHTLLVRGEIYPPFTFLLPGMYVAVTVKIPSHVMNLMVPQTAIVYNPYGNFVYLYKNGYVEQHYVHLGKSIGSKVVLISGLHMNDQVVVAGQKKLSNHSQVRVVDH